MSSIDGSTRPPGRALTTMVTVARAFAVRSLELFTARIHAHFVRMVELVSPPTLPMLRRFVKENGLAAATVHDANRINVWRMQIANQQMTKCSCWICVI